MKRLGDIAIKIEARLDGDPELQIERVRPLESAEPGDITYLARGRSLPSGSAIRATAIIVDDEFQRTALPDETALLVMANPRLGFQRILDVLSPPEAAPFDGIAASASVDPSAEIGSGVRIGPNVVISAGVKIGDGVSIYPGTFVGPDCRLDDDVTLHSNVSVYARSEIGARAIVHGGATIGSDGFGFEATASGAMKIQHIGRVCIEEDVEVGANCTIDRGVLDATVIGAGCKLDNQVHVGHNVSLGPHCMLAAQVGIAGSTTIGAGVLIGGQAGIAGHLTIGDGAQIGGGSGVTNDIPAGGRVFGYPATDFRTAGRAHAVFKELPEFRKELHQRIEELTRRIEQLLGE